MRGNFRYLIGVANVLSILLGMFLRLRYKPPTVPSDTKACCIVIYSFLCLEKWCIKLPWPFCQERGLDAFTFFCKYGDYCSGWPVLLSDDWEVAVSISPNTTVDPAWTGRHRSRAGESSVSPTQTSISVPNPADCSRYSCTKRQTMTYSVVQHNKDSRIHKS